MEDSEESHDKSSKSPEVNEENQAAQGASEDKQGEQVDESEQNESSTVAADSQPTVSSPRLMSFRLQPCVGPASSISLPSTTCGTVINLPTVYKSPEQMPAGGSDSKVSYFRLFNSSQLAGVSGANVVKPEQFATSVITGKCRISRQSNPVVQEQPVKRKRGRPRLNQPHRLNVAPLPIRTVVTRSKQTSPASVLKTSQLQKEAAAAKVKPDSEASESDSVPSRFTIADLPPEQRPSFAFRRDMRKQLMMKSLDQRISWALGKKVTVNSVNQPEKESGPPVMKTKSGRIIRPTFVRESDDSEENSPDDVEPEPEPAKTQSSPSSVKLIVNSPLPPPPRRRGRPRKIRLEEGGKSPPPPPPPPKMPPPPTTPSKVKQKVLITPPSPPDSPDRSPTNANSSVAAVEESLLSEDYIMRNLQYWGTKLKELEKRKEARRISRGPAKSVNVVLQSSSVNEEDEDASRGIIYSMRDFQERPPNPVEEHLRRYRPILPRAIDAEKVKGMTQEERLQDFRRRSENEKKMRLIRGVDFVPVHHTAEELAKEKAEESKRPAATRLEEILKEMVEDVPDDDVPDAEERDVDIDADPPPEVSLKRAPFPAEDRPVKKKKKKTRPVSHGTITDHSITQFDDPDVVTKELLPRKRQLEAEEEDDDEPPLIAAKPRKDTLVRSAEIGETSESDSQAGLSRDEKVAKKRQAKRPPNWPFGPAAPEEKRVFRPPSKPSTKIAPPVERRLIYSLMQNAVQLTMGKQEGEGGGSGIARRIDDPNKDEIEPLSYIVLESESEIESSDEEIENGEKKEKPPKKFSCAAVTIKLAATSKSSLVFAPPTNIFDESSKMDYDEGVDSGVEENGVLWKFPTQFFNGAKYKEIAPLVEQEEVMEPRRRTPRAPTAAMPWNAPDFGSLPPDNRCPHCTRHFSDSHRLWRHLISHSDKKPFVCSLCGKGHRLPEYLSYHHRLHHSSGEELLPCPHCPKRALFYSQLEAHLLNKHNAARPFICGQCSLTFALEASLEDHVRSSHELQPTVCDLCGLNLPDEVSRTLHRRQHTEERPYSCPDCPGKAFKSKRLLGHHRMVEHEMERQHECHKCLKTFFFLKDMQRHMATAHSHPEPFQCLLCNQQFLRRQQLTRHMEKSHRGVSNRPFRCQICGVCFPTERALERHQHHAHGDKHPEPPPTETTEVNPGKRKMFSCRYCDLLFTARSAVTQHIESVHIDTLALRCRHCRQPCLNHADLERHILEHKDRRETLQTRRPNRRLCVACGEMMASRSDLERHLKEEHDELVQFMCPICGEFFLTNQLYYEHTCRQEEEGIKRDHRTESYSSEEEPAGGQQNTGNIESQVEPVEGYQEWHRRPQWSEYPREEGGHYYSGW